MPRLIERAERLLRWSEKYMKTDMVYLAKGSFWLTLAQVAASASGLILVIGFANLLPKETYGTYRYVLSVASVIAAFSLSGMGVAVTQAVARGMDGVLRAAVRVQLRWSILMVLVAAGAAIYYFIRGDRAIGISLLIVGALSPVIESTSLYADFISGKKDFRTVALYGLIRNLVPVAVILTAIALTDDVILVVLAYFLSHAATSGALYLCVLKKYRPSEAIDPSSISFGKHASVTNLLSIGASQLDKILVFHYLGAVQLAVYGIAYSLPGQFKILMKMATTLIMPKMSAASLSTIRSAIHQKALRMFILFAGIVAVYVLAAPFVFRLLFPQYLEAVPLSQALALGYLFAPAILYSQTFFAQKRQKEMYVNKTLASVIRIILLLILLPAYGLWGAAYAYILGNALSFLVSFTLFLRMRE
jgi:O-antigen/teichoic acid export membrane protein